MKSSLVGRALDGHLVTRGSCIGRGGHGPEVESWGKTEQDLGGDQMKWANKET